MTPQMWSWRQRVGFSMVHLGPGRPEQPKAIWRALCGREIPWRAQVTSGVALPDLCTRCLEDLARHTETESETE